MSAARRVTGVVGELFITAGVVVLLFLGYQLVWTNVQADRVATAKADTLERTWDEEGPAGPEIDPNLQDGDAFAILRIPRLGEKYRVPIVQGVSLDDLATGVGHYPDTAMPGEIGNFSVAGHRATNGEPFAYLDQLREGDAVVVETGTTWYTYEVTAEYIVPPTQVGVILPVPNKPGVEPRKALMTLTTCNPRWASYERLIFHAELADELAKGQGRPAVLGGEA
ncbi:MAG: class E sortase [Actinomycetes bacterium]